MRHADPWDRVQRYVPPIDLSLAWRNPADAPFGEPFRCQARDNEGSYILPMRCIRTATGWISATTRTALHVAIIGWKY